MCNCRIGVNFGGLLLVVVGLEFVVWKKLLEWNRLYLLSGIVGNVFNLCWLVFLCWRNWWYWVVVWYWLCLWYGLMRILWKCIDIWWVWWKCCLLCRIVVCSSMCLDCNVFWLGLLWCGWLIWYDLLSCCWCVCVSVLKWCVLLWLWVIVGWWLCGLRSLVCWWWLMCVWVLLCCCCGWWWVGCFLCCLMNFVCGNLWKKSLYWCWLNCVFSLIDVIWLVNCSVRFVWLVLLVFVIWIWRVLVWCW